MFAAAVVGGGSAVNSMYLMRGSADDYDNWAKFGNPGWDFKGVLPYFKKVCFFRLFMRYYLIISSIEYHIHPSKGGTRQRVQHHLGYQICLWQRTYSNDDA